MKRKIKRAMRRNPRKRPKAITIYDYYRTPFRNLTRKLFDKGYESNSPHSIRENYWKHILDKEYSHIESRIFIEQYLTIVEKEIESIISKQSLAYWHHIVRRFSPTKMSMERDFLTTILVRNILELAFQKYSQNNLCDKIEMSHKVEIEDLFEGFFNTEEKKPLFNILNDNPQLILINFGLGQMAEFFELNKLAFEVWKCSSSLRVIAKGGSIEKLEHPEYFGLGYNDEINALIKSYDKRLEHYSLDHSATGTMIGHHMCKDEPDFRDLIMLPRYNYSLENSKNIIPLWQSLQKGYEFPQLTPNFLWLPFEIKSFYKRHKGFGKEFCRTHGVSFTDIVITIHCVSVSNFLSWTETPDPSNLIRAWQRAYTGPTSFQNLLFDLISVLPIALSILDISDITENEIDFESAISFLTLDSAKKKQISLLHRGPQSIFYPIFDNAYFIDYAWIHELLYSLFHRVNPDDQNFKGDALEAFMENETSPLTSHKLTSYSNEHKQVDISFDLGNGVLAIIECKAIAISIGYEAGDDTALKYRNDRIIDLLNQIDNKADWLRKNPVGRNYDISAFQFILPIGVTPFVEYIPSIDDRFWIDHKTPRILTPNELNGLIQTQKLSEISIRNSNLVAVNETTQ